MEYPVDHIINAMQAGAQIQQGMKRLKLAEKQYQQYQQAQEFAQKVQTARMNYDLMTNPAIRPVEGGTYEATTTGAGVPTDAMKSIEQLRSGGPAAVDVPQVSTPTRAPVRPGATMDWGGKSYTALSPDEQMEQRIRHATAMTNAEAMSQAQAAQSVREKFGVAPPEEVSDLYPSGYKVTPGELAKDVPVVMSTRREMARQRALDTREDRKREDDQAFRREEGRLNRESREDIARIAHAAGRGGLTPGQSGVQSRFDERQLDGAIKQMQDWQTQEQAQHSEREALGDILNTPDKQTYVDPKNQEEYEMNAVRRAALKRRYDAATSKVKDLSEKQRATRERFQLGEYENGAKPQAQPQTNKAAAPKQGKMRVRLADGRTGTIDATEFDPKTMSQL